MQCSLCTSRELMNKVQILFLHRKSPVKAAVAGLPAGGGHERSFCKPSLQILVGIMLCGRVLGQWFLVVY